MQKSGAIERRDTSWNMTPHKFALENTNLEQFAGLPVTRNRLSLLKQR